MCRALYIAITVVVGVAATGLVGCDTKLIEGESSEPSCTLGTEGCTCQAGGVCADGLSCDRGWCTPATTDCPRGQEGCACYANGSCDAIDGWPMTCDANICIETPMPVPGELGGPCDATIACDDYEGMPLECISGICQLPGCLSGNLGCPCGPFGACSEFEDQDVRCSEGICVIGDCEPGMLGCNCGVSDECDNDLVCQLGLCRYPNSVGVTVTAGGLRACDFLFEETGRASTDVVFASSVMGEFYSRSPRLAVALFSRTDEDLSGELFRVELAGGSPLEPGQLEPVSTQCYDRLGVAQDDAGMQME